MKFKIKSPYVKVGITAFLVIASSMFLVFLLFERNSAMELFAKIWHVFEPIVYGLLIAYMLNPIMQIFEKVLLWIVYKLKKSPSRKGRIAIRAIADFGSLFFLLYLFYALIAMIIPQLVESFQNLSRSYPIYFANITHWLEGLIANMHLDSSVAETVNKIGVDVSDWVANKIIPSVDVIVETVTGTLVNVAVFFKNSFLGMIVAIYFLMIKERLKARFKRLNYALFSINTGNQILNNLRFVNEKFGGFIIGKVVDSIIIGIICYVCMLVLRLPYPMLIAVFIGITNIIPVFGPFIGAIPSFILILGVNPMQALYFLILIIIIQQFDGNFLGPRILGNSVGLSSFMVMLAILIGSGLWGVMGMLVGVPIMAIVTALVQSKVLRSVIEKELPTTLRDYDNLYLIDASTRKPWEKRPIEHERSMYNIITSRSKLQKAHSPLIKEQSWEVQAEDVRQEMDLREWTIESERLFKEEKEEERRLKEELKIKNSQIAKEEAAKILK